MLLKANELRRLNLNIACVAGRRAREGKGGIGLGGEEEGTAYPHAHSLRAVVFPFPSPSTPATQANLNKEFHSDGKL